MVGSLLGSERTEVERASLAQELDLLGGAVPASDLLADVVEDAARVAGDSVPGTTDLGKLLPLDLRAALGCGLGASLCALGLGEFCLLFGGDDCLLRDVMERRAGPYRPARA